MRVSRAWLESMVATGWDVATLSHRLTMAGFEVEATAPVAGAFDLVVVGRIVAAQPHPGADRLRVCTVDVGAPERLSIVCGASNARAGLTAPVALIGARLPGGVAIKRAKLRGVESAGMLCSGRELGLGDDAEGLLELPDDLVPGTDLREALALDDTVFELNFTPNRGDALSVLGLARELAVLTGQPLRLPDTTPVPAGLPDTLPVVLDTPGCPRFGGRVLRGLNPAAPTPLWMRERLRRAGQRSLGPLVDVTNYVMLELGQPLHAYDLREVAGGVTVRQARPGEKLTLLDGKELDLAPDVMVVSADDTAVGLAGIMGGARSGVAPDTVDVYLEGAWWAPAAIAGRARRYGLLTDASQRFERGVDPEAIARALERATALFLAIAGGAAGPLVITQTADGVPVQRVIFLREKSVKRLIGIEIPADRIESILTALGLQLTRTAEGWQALVPSWRFDLALEADLIEEVARVYGYNEIPEIDQAVAALPVTASERQVSDERYACLLAERGYHETINYTFVDPALQRTIFPQAEALDLANPLSSELAQMRVSLLPGLIQVLKANERRQVPRARLFEIGARFVVTGAQLAETPTLAGLVWGSALPEQWGVRASASDFFDVKADVEAVLAASGRGVGYTFVAGGPACLHPGRCARILRDGQAVGYLGELHPELAADLALDGAVHVFELDLNLIKSSQLPVSQEISRFPHIRRDLAVVVDESTTFNELQQSVTVCAAGLLRELKVFDVYRGKGIETGRKSVALGLILQETSRTLTDAEADAVVSRVTAALQRDLNAVLRD